MIKCLFISALVIYSFTAFSQVVNVENKRFNNDTVKFAGRLKFKLIGVKNQVETFEYGNSLSLQYQENGNKWLFVGDLNYISVDSIVSDNSAFGHLRFTKSLSDLVSFETFVQAQNNKLLHIDLRAIAGGGLRFNALKKDKAQIYYGISCFYEHERNNKDHEIFDEARMSTYLSYHFVFGETAELSNTTYFQPVAGQISDHRIFNELALTFNITSSFSFESTYFVLYDSHRPVGIPHTIWRYENKLVINF